MKELASWLRRLCAVILGIVFFTAGVLKLVDPVGAGLVVRDYLGFFHLGFLSFGAKAFGFIFAYAECICGAALLTGVFRRFFSIAVSALVCFFTFLTLILAIFNPPMDCGCFGEAVHLSNLQTFLKNLVLLGLCLAAFLPYRDTGIGRIRKMMAFGVVSVLTLWFGIWSLRNVPLVEFTDFAIGKEIVSEGNVSDFKATFVYTKDGEEKTFTVDNLPDTTWTFVCSRVESDMPPRSAFDLGMPELSTGRYMLVDIYDPLALRGDYFERLAAFKKASEDAGFTVLVLSDLDHKMMITLSRSNGGVVRVEDGMVTGKYVASKLPGAEEISRMTSESATEDMMEARRRGRIRLQLCAATALLLMII